MTFPAISIRLNTANEYITATNKLSDISSLSIKAIISSDAVMITVRLLYTLCSIYDIKGHDFKCLEYGKIYYKEDEEHVQKLKYTPDQDMGGKE